MHMEYTAGTPQKPPQLHKAPTPPLFYQVHMPQLPLRLLITTTPQQYDPPQAQPSAYRQQQYV